MLFSVGGATSRLWWPLTTRKKIRSGNGSEEKKSLKSVEMEKEEVELSWTPPRLKNETKFDRSHFFIQAEPLVKKIAKLDKILSGEF